LENDVSVANVANKELVSELSWRKEWAINNEEGWRLEFGRLDNIRLRLEDQGCGAKFEEWKYGGDICAAEPGRVQSHYDEWKVSQESKLSKIETYYNEMVSWYVEFKWSASLEPERHGCQSVIIVD